MTKYISILFLILMLASCGEDFLVLAPKNKANVTDFFSNENDFEVALMGAYGTLKSSGFADRLPELFDLRADNATALAHNGTGQAISDFILDETHSIVSAFYTSAYQGIQASNAILDRIEGTNIDTDTKNTIIGEAKFLRALRYFYLVNVYGDVPLVLEEITGANLEETREITRTPVDQVYEAIIADLQDAEQKLSEFDVPHRASTLAAKALLGKVYLFQKNYAEAASKLKEVISSDQFVLLTDFSSLYEVGNASNTESIFTVEHVGGSNGTGSSIGFRMHPGRMNMGNFYISNQSIYVETNLYKEFSSDDADRRDMAAFANYAPGDEYGDTTYVCYKFYDANPFESGNASNTNYLLRYADVLLMYAEATNKKSYSEGSDAFKYLNMILERAGLETVSSSDLPDQSSFDEFVFDQRRLELAMEGHRWLDLIRTGRALDVMNNYLTNKIIGQNDLLYPIPQSEVLNNPDKIEQNPGY